MASYSIQYLYTLKDRFSQPVRKLGKASQAAGKLVQGSGKAADLASAAIGRMGGASMKSARGADKLGSATRRATGTVAAIDRAAKSAAASLHAMGAAAASSMAKAAHAAAYVRGYGGKLGPNEAAARGKGLSAVLSGRNLDEQMRSAYMGSGAAGKASGGGGSGRGGGFLGGSMRIMGASGMGARMGAYGASPGMIAGMGGALGTHSLLSRFADFEEAEIMSRTIGKRIGQTTAQMDALISTSRKLGASTKFEPQDVLGGGLRFLKSGYTAGDASTALPSTLSLAALSDQTVEKTTDQVINIMAQAKIPASQLKETTQQLYASFINAKAEMGELAIAAGYGLTKMTDVGLTPGQSFATLAAMSQGGQVGSKSGRGFAMMISSLQKAETVPRKLKAMKKHGLDLDDYLKEGRFKSPEAYEALIKRMSEIHRRDASFLTELLPANADRAMMAALINYETYQKVMAGQKDLLGSSAVGVDAEATFQGLTGSIRQLSAAWSELGIAFGKSGTGQYVEQAVRNITSLVGELSTSLNIGSFIEELFDPASMAMAAASIGLRIQSTITRGVVGGIQGFLNTVTEAVGLGAGGDWIVKGLGLEALMDRLDQSIKTVDDARGMRLQTVRDRVAQRGLNERVGEFSKEGYRRMMSGVKLPDDPVPAEDPNKSFLPTRNPNRIPQAAGERIKVESTMKGQIEPLAVTVTAPNTITLRLPNGMIAGSVPVGASSNAPRGVSAIDHGSSVIAP